MNLSLESVWYSIINPCCSGSSVGIVNIDQPPKTLLSCFLSLGACVLGMLPEPLLWRIAFEAARIWTMPQLSLHSVPMRCLLADAQPDVWGVCPEPCQHRHQHLHYHHHAFGGWDLWDCLFPYAWPSPFPLPLGPLPFPEPKCKQRNHSDNKAWQRHACIL